MSQPEEVYRVLDALGIEYERLEHPPVFTATMPPSTGARYPATPVKNLFLRNKKGDRHYLVILEIAKAADLRQLVKAIGDDRLSFGSPERLMAQLGLTPGSVSPFGLHSRRLGTRPGDRRRGPARRRTVDLPPEHQHCERHDQRAPTSSGSWRRGGTRVRWLRL